MAKSTKKTATPTATIQVQAPSGVAAEDRLTKSTVKHPVARVWVECYNATAAAGGEPPKRAELHKLCHEVGIAYGTARTQVDKFLRWHRNGAPAEGLPRDVTIG